MNESEFQDKLNLLVEHFLTLGNFDHPDMDSIAEIGRSFGVSELDAGKAFFVARERASLIEVGMMDGDDSAANQSPNYGTDSIYQMLFERTNTRRSQLRAVFTGDK